MRKLVKENSEAKDNSKFLNTLERQFKILQAGDLQAIEQCMSSLLNGLRLVFVISRYYKQEDRIGKLLTIIANEICEKVRDKIRIADLLKPKKDTNYEEQLANASVMISQGKNVLDKWISDFLKTKDTLEQEGGERWDFSSSDMINRANTMRETLRNFFFTTTQLQRLLELLGPKLKSVTGNTDGLEKLVQKAKDLVRPFETFAFDFFSTNKELQEKANQLFQAFKSDSENIQKEATSLIEDTFKVLRSSESGFEFLQKFNVDALEEVRNNMMLRYGDVLYNYKKELENNKMLFQKGKETPQGKLAVLTKNRPPIAGLLSWDRSILQRVMIPMHYFKQKEENFDETSWKNAKEQYKKFYDEVESFDKIEFEDWRKNITQLSNEFLSNLILKEVVAEDGTPTFAINFSHKFRVLISEAKYLDRTFAGFNPDPSKPPAVVDKKILNIALQEEEYYRYIDKIEKMLREYNASIRSLKDVEKDLLQAELNKLRKDLLPGTKSYYLNSLGINEFIENCRTQIKKFNDIKNKVDEKTRNIEDIIRTIEEAKILKDYDFSELTKKHKSLADYPTMQDFVSYFEKHMTTTMDTLSDKYLKIGSAMLPQIGMAVFTATADVEKIPEMRKYFYYWERRVYNALVKMIARALLTLKALLKRSRKPGVPNIPLFKVVTEYVNQLVIPNPNTAEIKNSLEGLRDSIIECAARFPRWKDGTCICVEKPTAQLGVEKSKTQHTFFDDINRNKVVESISAELNELVSNANEKIMKIKKEWEFNEEENLGEENAASAAEVMRKSLFNSKYRSKIDKLLEKNPVTSHFESYLDAYYNLLKEFEGAKNEADADFIKLDFSKPKKSLENDTKERIRKIGTNLTKIVDKESQELKTVIFDYYNEIRRPEDSREQVKKCLNTLAKIRDSTEEKEQQIAEIIEKCRILKKYESYGIDFDANKYQTCLELGKLWTKLLHKSKSKLDEIKKSLDMFEKQTESEVKKLTDKIDKLYEMYTKTGPGAFETTLDEGVDKLRYFRKEVDLLNASKSETVKMQKLFGMEIKTFPKLGEMDKELKDLDIIYSFYSKIKGIIDELSRKQWEKFDIKELEETKRMFRSKVKEFSKNANLNTTHVFKKLELNSQDFEKPLGLIESLKSNPHFKETHWERLMKLINKPTDGINFSMITLQQVLNWNLSEHSDKVDEIMNAAHQEYKNKRDLVIIEEFWRTANFEVSDHKKGAFKIKVSEEIKLALDEHLNSLQGIESSKFAGTALKNEVRRWMDSLVKIQETVEEWIKVQNKWLNLEVIYIANEDIRTQLSKETKTFEQHHKTFKNLNEKCSKNANIFANCVLNDNTLLQLQNLSSALDKSQKSLTEYLNGKKKVFPRFYFISDADLLLILGSSDPTSIQSQLIKLFDNVKSLGFEKGKIVSMSSMEAESFSFSEPYKPDGAVEVWMTKVDELMVDTLKKMTKEGVYRYAKMDRNEWMQKYVGMIVIVGRQIWWTWRVEDVFRKVKEGDKYAMKKEASLQSEELRNLVSLVRSDLEAIDPSGKFRKKINNLIIVDVHGRDIVDRFVRDSILDAREFEWESQLRFYWRNNINDILIEQCTGSFRFGYEYQGLTSRLVITPLTDRCVMTLTTALTFCLGGAPAGPAGTGKTETCKDLGKNLAIRTVVTNCGENFDVFAMETNFSGLCQTGFWGVFDEFNRILPEVLSVVSTMISDIQRGLVQNKSTVELRDQEINLKATVGIFVTMNPGYEGRSELPDNLKALFRPVTMVVPDNKIICENMLMSEGFQEARMLAKKMTVLYQLSKEQLSKQFHYDFGLRPLKAVLVQAGGLKRVMPDLSEEDVIMRALKDMNLPKFVFEDVTLFQGLLNDLFPGRSVDAVSQKDLNQRALECQAKKGLQELPNQAQKVIQLFETMETRHTTMVVGPTGSGKTTIIELLKDAKTVPNVRNVVYYIMNQKAQSLDELYGKLDPQTREWKDGILAKTFKFANEDLPERGPTDKGPKEELRWILFDGDVDAVWVENMNSVMDDNRLLTLSNGDRIRLQNFCKLLFEVFDLQYASPATISRCGMVYVDPKNLGYEPYFKSWQAKILAEKEVKELNPKEKTAADKEKAQEKQDSNKESREQLNEMFTELYGKYIKPLIEFLFEGKAADDGSGGASGPVEQTIHRTSLNLVQQFTNIMDTMLPEDIYSLATESNRVESMFIYSCVWSLGSCIKSEKMGEAFIQYLRGLPSIVLPDKSLYDYVFEGQSWVPVKNKVIPYVSTQEKDFSKILIPTVDTVKLNYLLNLLQSKGKPTLFVGEPGTAKTVIVKNYLSTLKMETNVVLNINFSSRTDSMEVQRSVESVTDKRRPGIYGPKGNKKLIIFIDELHMPKVDKYGTQQPIALLKFLIDKKLMYERGGTLEKREYRDCQYIAALLPPGGGYNAVDPRFLSLFNCITIQFPKEENIKTIYNSILQEHFKSFPKEFEETAKEVTSATYKLFQEIVIALPRSPSKFHYIFNLRDLSKLYQGLLRSEAKQFNTKEKFVRLWKNEVMRVFVDRLVTENDKKIVTVDIINPITKEVFGDDMMKKLNEGDFLYGDFKDSQPTEPDYEDPMVYQNLDSYAKLRKKCEELLLAYNEEHAEMNLVLFNDALDHLVRLIRVIRFNRGHAMLVGFGGSGKQSITQLASFICSYDLFTVSVKKNYNEAAFKKDLGDLYIKLALEPIVFMFTDSQMIEDSFLELVNTILTVGHSNSVFEGSIKADVLAKFEPTLKKSYTSDEVWELLCETLRNNLHVVLCVSPAGESLRIRCRNFPGLISNTTIDWFFPWPAEALRNVAEVYLKEMAFEPELYEKIVSHFVFVHQQIPEYAQKFESNTRKKVYNTPKNYLDFLKCYITQLEDNKKMYRTIISDYEKGLDKLKESQAQIAKMSEEIEIDKIEVEKKRKEVKEIEADIKFKQKAANESSARAQEKKIALKEKSEQITIQKAKADELFESKKPELEEAKKKVREIKPSDLTFAANLANPTQAIKEVGKLIQILKVNEKCDPVGLEWGTAQLALKDSNILSQLADFDISSVSEKQIKRAETQIAEIVKNLEITKKSMFEVSSAMNSIFIWAQSTTKFYTVFQEITKLQKKAKELSEEQDFLAKDLAATEKKIEELTQSLKELNAAFQANDRLLKELTKRLEEMTNTLNNAVKLLDGLGAEEIRWSKDKELKSIKIGYLEGECLMSASFLSYFGPFDQEFRKQMTEAFKEDITNKEIAMGEGFKVEELLTTDVQITQWNSEGLPSDELSVQNGILTTQSSRYPLCIDPQLQAIKWIKKKEKNIAKYTTNFNDNELTRKLEMAFTLSEPILIENIGEDLDPVIENVLLKKYITIGGVQKVKIDKEVDVPMGSVAKNFILYMTTKLPNPHYSPEVMGKASVINYSVNISGLAEQLLSEVVRHEAPDDDALRNRLITQTSENMSELKMLQTKILESLVNSGNNIIQDTNLINTLQISKTKSKELEVGLAESTKTKANLEAARLNYVPVSKRGAILFFCMQKLTAISDMYQYSLSSYLEVFKRSLTDSVKDDVIVTRIKIIIEKLTQNVYDYVTLGIFKNHRRLFTFQMTLMIKEGEGDLNLKELDFFLKGNTNLGDSREGKTISWLTEANCKDLEALSDAGEVWKNFYMDVRSNGSEWKRWFDLENPEEHPLPSPWNNLIKSKFQLLLILRVMRSDRISLGIDRLIVDYFSSDHYIRVPVLKEKWLLSQISPNIPIIYILSPGADPSSFIRNLATTSGFTGKKFMALSLGQGMEEEAVESVKNAYSRGYWVLLQNCDLLPHCIKALEKNIEGENKPPHADFRLWMTTQPTSKFPLGILQRALKLVTEPPAGIKNNMEDVINRTNEEPLKNFAHPAFRPLNYVITFMHAVVLDRAKYGKIGWNVTYDFNFSDFQISFRLLQLYLKKSTENGDDTIPWDSLKYLIGEAMYGGRVTDEFDRRTLMTYLDEYLGDFLFDKNNEFFFADSNNFKYKLPAYTDKDSLAASAATLPNTDSPVVFGLNLNAEITYYTNDAKNLWINFLKMESVGGSSISPQERDKKIESIAIDLLSKTTYDYDPAALRLKRLEDQKELKPTDVVLFQEMDRFKNLSNKMQTTLNNLLRALSGKIGMNAELDELAVSLYNSFLPTSWAKLAPSTEKKLGSWINHFMRRRNQYVQWYNNGEPDVMWLSGLHIPESYLTALVQAACRAKGWALDKSTLFTSVTTETNPDNISRKPEFGCYVTGLYLEGIAWDIQRNSLRAQHPKELIYEMPVMRINPIEFNKLKLKDSIKIPVYVTQNRRNAKGVGHVFDADLNTSEHPSHWILQGAALVLNTDD